MCRKRFFNSHLWLPKVFYLHTAGHWKPVHCDVLSGGCKHRAKYILHKRTTVFWIINHHKLGRVLVIATRVFETHVVESERGFTAFTHQNAAGVQIPDPLLLLITTCAAATAASILLCVQRSFVQLECRRVSVTAMLRPLSKGLWVGSKLGPCHWLKENDRIWYGRPPKRKLQSIFNLCSTNNN